MKQLIGHTSQETAYVVDDYPYGFTLRTQIRYWIETKKSHGQRFCSQTLNPKTGRWNKPKCNTYSRIEVLGLDETTGYVTSKALGIYSDEAAWQTFLDTYVLDDAQREEAEYVIKAKRFINEVIGKREASK